MHPKDLVFPILAEPAPEPGGTARARKATLLLALVAGIGVGDGIVMLARPHRAERSPAPRPAFRAPAPQRSAGHAHPVAPRKPEASPRGGLPPARPAAHAPLRIILPPPLPARPALTTRRAPDEGGLPPHRGHADARPEQVLTGAAGLTIALDPPEHGHTTGEKTSGQRFTEALDRMFQPVSILDAADAAVSAAPAPRAPVAAPPAAPAQVQPDSVFPPAGDTSVATAPPASMSPVTAPAGIGFTVALRVNGKDLGGVTLLAAGTDDAHPEQVGSGILIRIADIVHALRPLMDQATYEALIAHDRAGDYVSLADLREQGIAASFDRHDRLNLLVRAARAPAAAEMIVPDSLEADALPDE